ncbi:hypothetical protein, partial [Ruminococcus sp. RTP21358st1_A5_RTP21358_211008]|uniref:hypothetical protein n=1 Tax=unclassified Ruminococcus TaxID=2608920 RepID=UPI0034A28EAD
FPDVFWVNCSQALSQSSAANFDVLPFCRIKRRIHAKGHPSGVFYYEFFQKRKGGRQCAL